MAITSINNALAASYQAPVYGKNGADKDDKGKDPATAPENHAKNHDSGDNTVKKAPTVQPQESKSSVKQTIDTFA